MRYPGENAAGRAPARRQNPSGRQGPSGRVTPPETRPGPSAVRAGGKAGQAALFAPGYSGGRAPDHAPAEGARWYEPAGGAAGKGPVRGFAPAPGQPPPFYPPGQFAAWNRASAPDSNGYDPSVSGPIGDAWPASADTGYPAAWAADAGYADAGYSDAGYADGRYPEQVSDPAPDVTSTVTWGTDALDYPDRDADRATTDPGQRAATGPFDRATPAPFNRVTTAPSSQRAATGPGTGSRPAQAPSRGPGSRGRGSRRRKRPRRRASQIRILLAGGLALIVVAGAAYFLLSGGHKPSAPAADAQPTTGVRSSPTAPSPSPSPSLGAWGHIESRALDPVPLSLTELFPASFTDGTTTYVMTVEKAKVHCAGALAGSQLISAVSHAGCTQAMRASYLSSGNQLMGTVGVLNLITTAAAEQAGKAAGPSEFIAQLPAASGPTKSLTKGTGFEAAEVKGHYLVLVWAEFADLHAPKSPAQRAQLEDFISLLMQKTANVSLATRQVTGSPPS
jgi:hypothetical protein